MVHSVAYRQGMCFKSKRKMVVRLVRPRQSGAECFRLKRRLVGYVHSVAYQPGKCFKSKRNRDALDIVA